MFDGLKRKKIINKNTIQETQQKLNRESEVVDSTMPRGIAFVLRMRRLKTCPA